MANLKISVYRYSTSGLTKLELIWWAEWENAESLQASAPSQMIRKTCFLDVPLEVWTGEQTNAQFISSKQRLVNYFTLVKLKGKGQLSNSVKWTGPSTNTRAHLHTPTHTFPALSLLSYPSCPHKPPTTSRVLKAIITIIRADARFAWTAPFSCRRQLDMQLANSWQRCLSLSLSEPEPLEGAVGSLTRSSYAQTYACHLRDKTWTQSQYRFTYWVKYRMLSWSSGSVLGPRLKHLEPQSDHNRPWQHTCQVVFNVDTVQDPDDKI